MGVEGEPLGLGPSFSRSRQIRELYVKQSVDTKQVRSSVCRCHDILLSSDNWLNPGKHLSSDEQRHPTGREPALRTPARDREGKPEPPCPCLGLLLLQVTLGVWRVTEALLCSLALRMIRRFCSPLRNKSTIWCATQLPSPSQHHSRS